MKSLAAGVLAPRKLTPVAPDPTRASSIQLPDGRVLSEGDVFTVRGAEGQFKFMYARRGEVTGYGGPAGYGAFRTFRPEKIRSTGKSARVEAVKSEIASVDTSMLTPGQKAALTKKLRAAQATAAVA